MKILERDSVEGEFFTLIVKLTDLLRGNQWRFWHKALKKFLNKKPPFKADESDVSISIEVVENTPEGLVADSRKIFGNEVVSDETVAFFLKHSKSVEQGGRKFVIGNESDLFGMSGATDPIFYDRALVNDSGLDFCEPADAFILRNQMTDQESGEGLYIMTPPLEGDDGKLYYLEVLRYVPYHSNPSAFRVIHTETGPGHSSVGRRMVFRLKE